MKKISKRIISFCMAVLLAQSSINMEAFAEGDPAAEYTIMYTLTIGEEMVGGNTSTFKPSDESTCKLKPAYKKGKNLWGWYTEAGCINPIRDSDLKNQTGNITVYPKWDDASITIRYYLPNAELTGYTSSTVDVIRVSSSEIEAKGATGYEIPSLNNSAQDPRQYATAYNSGHADKKVFAGFTTDSAGSTSKTHVTMNDFDFKINEAGTAYEQKTEIILYPKYEASPTLKCTLDKNDNGGNPTSATCDKAFISVFAGGTYGELPTPSRPGYDFVGWYTDPTTESDDTRVYESTAVTAMVDFSIYAHWKGKSYTVTFDANGGINATTSKTVTFGSQYGSLPTPTRTNCTFQGWFTAKTGETKITSTTNVTRNENHTLVALWLGETINIEFDGNGSTGGTTANMTDVTFADSTTHLTQNGFTRTGYIFDGWSVTKVGSAATNIADEATLDALPGSAIKDDPITNKKKIVLYAQWKANTYTVKFNTNDGNASETSKEVTYDSVYGSLDTPTYTKINQADELKAFENWYTAQVGGDKITATTKVTTASDHKLYAHWNPAVVYNIKFYPNYGTGTGTGQMADMEGVNSANPETRLTKNAFNRVGYSFAYWNEFTNPTSTQILQNSYLDEAKTSSIPVTISTSEVKLYAQWSANQYTVSFDGNGGTVPANSISRKVTYDKTYQEVYGEVGNVALPTPTRNGYQFTGWYTEKTSGTRVTEVTKVTVASNHVLYAHWRAYTFTLIFDKNDYLASGTMDDQGKNPQLSFDNDTTITKNAFTKTGWSFVGWNQAKSPAANAENIPDEASITKINVTADGSITLYAQWKKDTYIVTLNANGGTVSPGYVTVEYNENIPTLPTPTYNGYEFKGWYTQKEGGEKVSSGDKNLKTENYILYARWELCTYTIRFNANGGTGAMDDMGSLTVLDTTTSLTQNKYSKVGYTFREWNTVASPTAQNPGIIYQNEAKTSTIKVDKQNSLITLYAQWQANGYQVTFDANGGTLTTSTKIVYYDRTYETLPIPTRNGYEFKGWWTEKSGGTEVKADTKVTITKNQTLYAHWSAYTFSVEFNGNPGIGAVVLGTPMSKMTGLNFDKDAETKLTKNTYSKTGYSFIGWNLTEIETSTSKYADESLVTKLAIDENNKEVKLYANWSPNPYKVVLHSNTTKNEVVEQNLVYDKKTKLEKNKFENGGSDFKCWNTRADGAGTSYQDEAEVKNLTSELNGVVHLYALWSVSKPKSNVSTENPIDNGTKVSLFVDEQNADIYYTINGNTPTTASNHYENPIVINENTTIKAITHKMGYVDSAVAEFKYEVKGVWGDVDEKDRTNGAVPEGFWIKGIDDVQQVYDGSKKTFDGLRVYYGNLKLVENTDYTISYKNNVNAALSTAEKNAPTIIIKGKGGYSGTYTTNFTIYPASIDGSNNSKNVYSVSADLYYVYDGKQKTGKFTLYKNGKALSTKDYEVSGNIQTSVNESGYPITITGKRNYSGTYTATTPKLFITNRTLITKASVKFDKKSYTYDEGKEIIPKITVKVGKTTLRENIDYKLVLSNNTTTGKGLATITGQGTYFGTKLVYFTINGISIKGSKVNGFKDSRAFIAKDVEVKQPTLTVVTSKGTTLVLDRDYTIGYTNNTKAGTATLIITGVGQYSGVIKKNFKIEPYLIYLSAVKAEYPTSIAYEKGGVRPEPVLTYSYTYTDDDGKSQSASYVMVKGRDYTLGYGNNTKVNNNKKGWEAPTVYVYGKGNFSSNRSTERFAITQKNIKDSNVTVYAADKKAGKNYKSTPVIIDCNGKRLAQNTDFKILSYTYANDAIIPKNATLKVGDELKVTVEGKGNYTGQRSIFYKITANDISKVKFKVPDQYYTGKAITPDKTEIIAYTTENKVDISFSSYEIISYSNNVKKGTGKIVVRGTGQYGGVRTINFKISQKKF